ncbi:glutamine synthetase [Chelativorans sp. ZYF759]|uniref:glutamine synthetase family protein n=1 Tax=Chelativorans sp. ZYF759 TaxID=2692213 RepID=UPI00145C5BFD|nr:glutamine synthetase family protein [Chelativorans sp. ZYF759]NMG37846.1 glutamine synthetase [Chelativorans sp. ZYF759]
MERSLRNGLVGEKGLLDDQAFSLAEEVIRKAEEQGLETIRLSFADQHGVLRGKTVVVSQLASAFRSGLAMTSTLLLKDTSHRTVFSVWGDDIGFGEGVLTGAGDVMIVPDPSTFKVLPWSPHSGWFLCDVHARDGSKIPFCSRSILRDAIGKLDAAGMNLVCGLEVEFYMLKLDEPRLAHADGGMPAEPPRTSLIAHGYQYLTEARYDALEDVMDELRRASQALGLPVRSMEAEFGPSQCEFTFDPDGPLAHADAMMLFRSMVKQMAARRGLHATFMCRPKLDNVVPSGWHLHQSLVDARDGRNLFIPAEDGSLSPQASGWIAGLLEHAAASCLLTTPTVNGYKRYQPFQLAPDRIQWGNDNKGAMIRALMAPGDKASRIENRVAEPTANPYLYFASQILGGLDGISRGLKAPPPIENPYANDSIKLPQSLVAAIERFEASSFYREALGDVFVNYLTHIKRAEWDRYLMTVSEWEQREYFSLF